MEVEFKQLVAQLRSRAGDEGEEEATAQQIAKDLHGARSLLVKKQDFQVLTDLALDTPSKAVRRACVEALATLVPIVKNSEKVFDENLLSVCLGFAEDAEAGPSCLAILVLIFSSNDHELVAKAVKRGGVDTLLRAIQNAYTRSEPNRVADVLLGGLVALAQTPEYALELHEKSLWSFLMSMYERTQTVTTNFLRVTQCAVQQLLVPKFRHCRAKDARKVLDLEPNSLPPTDILYEYFPSRGYTEEDGLVDEYKMNEADMDLASQVCYQISQSGLLLLVLGLTRRIEHHALTELCLDTLGNLAPVMYKTLTRRSRISLVRELVNLVPSLRDSRLSSIVVILEVFTGETANQEIVCQCATVPAFAEKGLRMLQRHDAETRRICRSIVDLFFQISMLPNGPAELSTQMSVRFLQEAMADIDQIKLKRRSRDSRAWMEGLEVNALLTLINVALQSPVMTSMTEANLHQALGVASARPDELGLLAVLGSSFFLGRSTAAYSSRELPRLQPEHVGLLTTLFTATANGEPSFGEVYWSTSELLQAMNYLALAPHNGIELKPVLPSILAALRTMVKDGPKADAEQISLLIKVLLSMSYHKEIMSELVARHNHVDKLLRQARRLLAGMDDSQRDIDTLLTSIDSEEVAKERLPYRFGNSGVAFVKRVSRSLARSSLTKSRFSKSSSATTSSTC